MSDSVRIRLDGDPVGKGRPRFVRKTGHAYTPEKTRAYEERLSAQAAIAMLGRKPFEGPVECYLHVFVAAPKSWSEKKRREAVGKSLPVPSKPDIDNYFKMLDALNGIVWNDDSQIVQGSFTKSYTLHPGIVVTVSPFVSWWSDDHSSL
jgi:Holliday junction resolvase RusA-like endonuclease